MRRLLVAAALVLVGITLLGFIRGDGRDDVRLTTINEPTLLTVVITLKYVTDEYRWLSVHGCSADVTENGSFCNGDFERESSLELFGRKQELIYWRHLPPGTMRITAMVFDENRKIIASGQTMVFRGR